jgi:IMP and pyridine-specific 5'-nucleotidase
MTLYADGKNFSADSHLVKLLVGLLRKDIFVAIVTAAGYPGQPEQYEHRLSGLLEGFKKADLPPQNLEKFFVLGGECNYLFRYDSKSNRLVSVPNAEFQNAEVKAWNSDKSALNAFLDVAHENIKRCSHQMGLCDQITIIRKELSLGIVPCEGVALSRECLDEFALSTQRVLKNHRRVQELTNPTSQKIPFCAFNGGSDVWVDIGNKLIGVKLLQEYLKAKGHETLHVGDQVSIAITNM